VDCEIRKRETDYKSSWKYYLDEFLLAFEELGYNLGIIAYEYDH